MSSDTPPAAANAFAEAAVELGRKAQDARGKEGALLALTSQACDDLAEGLFLAGELWTALDLVLVWSGARGRYHALRYADAVEQAEAILRRSADARGSKIGGAQ